MTILSLSNLVIYSAQILLVVAAATIGGHILRLSAPRPRFAFWRAVVAACLLLPLWPTRIDVATTSTMIGGAETVASRSDVTVVSPTDDFHRRRSCHQPDSHLPERPSSS